MPVLGSGSPTLTSQVTTFLDIYTEILNKMRQPLTNAAIIEQAKRYANTALHDIVLGFEYKLPWLEREGTLITMAPYIDGTVSIARGSTTLTGLGTLWKTNNVYGVNNARTTGKISLGDTNIYTVTTVVSDTEITLTQRYVADTNLAAGAAYSYFEDEYTLAPDFLKLIDAHRFSNVYDITLIGRNEFRATCLRATAAGTPRVATLLDKAFAGSSVQPLLVQLYPHPSSNLVIPYAYVTSNLAVSSAGVEAAYMSADTDEPVLPIRYRHALISYAISKWYRDKKDDARADSAKGDYIDEVTRILNDQRIGTNVKAQITPKIGMYKNRPYRGLSRRFSINNSFDEFRS